MVTYTLHYREPGIFRRWKKIKNVKGDGILENNSHRYFILEDESRIELPLSFSFRFDKGRFESIRERMSEEASQDIRIKKS